MISVTYTVDEAEISIYDFMQNFVTALNYQTGCTTLRLKTTNTRLRLLRFIY